MRATEPLAGGSAEGKSAEAAATPWWCRSLLQVAPETGGDGFGSMTSLQAPPMATPVPTSIMNSPSLRLADLCPPIGFSSPTCSPFIVLTQRSPLYMTSEPHITSSLVRMLHPVRMNPSPRTVPKTPAMMSVEDHFFIASHPSGTALKRTPVAFGIQQVRNKR